MTSVPQWATTPRTVASASGSDDGALARRSERHPDGLLAGSDLHRARRLRSADHHPPELLGQIDALVASWLPGSEGTGVADVLFGAKRFTGKLPVTWPRSVDQEPINVGDAEYDPCSRTAGG